MTAYRLIVVVLLSVGLAQSAFAESDLIPIQTIMLEATPGGRDMPAIAQTIRKRAKIRDLRPDQVCKEPRQYSCWNAPLRAYKWLKRHGSGALYQRASKAWYESKFLPAVFDHYHRYDIKPRWARGLGVRIGDHVFYNLGG